MELRLAARKSGSFAGHIHVEMGGAARRGGPLTNASARLDLAGRIAAIVSYTIIIK